MDKRGKSKASIEAGKENFLLGRIGAVCGMLLQIDNDLINLTKAINVTDQEYLHLRLIRTHLIAAMNSANVSRRVFMHYQQLRIKVRKEQKTIKQDQS